MPLPEATQGSNAPIAITLYIPCFNSAKYLDKVLPAAKQQTYPIAEILVVDDGSTDGTVAVARQHGVRVVSHERNLGLAAARNTAVRAATTHWVASLDSDVVARPDWLERLVRSVLSSDDIAGAGGRLIETQFHCLADHWRGTHLRQEHTGDQLDDPGFLFGNNNLYRRDRLIEVGLYDEAYRTNGEDASISNALKVAGYRLVYNPSAVCEHLRTDSLRSICRTVWRYNHHKPEIPTLRKTLQSRRFGRRLLWSLLKKDVRAGRFGLAWVDVVMYWNWFFRDWGRFVTRNSRV